VAFAEIYRCNITAVWGLELEELVLGWQSRDETGSIFGVEGGMLIVCCRRKEVGVKEVLWDARSGADLIDNLDVNRCFDRFLRQNEVEEL